MELHENSRRSREWEHCIVSLSLPFSFTLTNSFFIFLEMTAVPMKSCATPPSPPPSCVCISRAEIFFWPLVHSEEIRDSESVPTNCFLFHHLICSCNAEYQFIKWSLVCVDIFYTRLTSFLIQWIAASEIPWCSDWLHAFAEKCFYIRCVHVTEPTQSAVYPNDY